MVFRWNPKWSRRKFIYEGMEIETCVDLITGLILCPICTDIDNVCPEGKGDTQVVPEKAAYFFTVQDLIEHIKAHATSSWERKRVPIAIEEGGEESEEE
ncbi:MAG: hypothetical protein DRO15_03970 [Thermoprotei archaeon]|nr:MAG: hypothetical protein DRO15_03970 [Thermoprotei archaeon]